VGALALAPLSIVQAVLSGGLVLLAVLAERYFGFTLRRRQWTGVIVTAAGLAVIAVTGGSHMRAVRHYSLPALIAVECGVFALGAALIRISMRARFGPAAEGLLLGVAAGVLLGVSDIALKYLTGALHGGFDVSEWTLTAVAASVLAFYASARGLQLGPGVAVIAFTSVAANLAAIMGGILVFRDPIGIGALASSHA
jgi:drug/metabolite transporter (DMT)-like permease